jgi:hypothetical protein
MTYAAAKQGVRSTMAVVIGVAVFGLAGGEAVAAEGGFESLFDGASLAGWQASENPSTWKVVDGAIVCHGPRSHLFYVGPDAARPVEFRDFHLRAEIMTRPGSNSGVFFHTAFQDEGWPQQGYEVQVNNTQRDPVRTGSIYNVVKNFTPPAKDDEWFLLEVVVKGKTVRVSVDERVLFEFVEPEGVTGTRRLSRGLVALQGHDPDSEVHYRRVEIKPLD